jgi:hypothetical protein
MLALFSFFHSGREMVWRLQKQWCMRERGSTLLDWGCMCIVRCFDKDNGGWVAHAVAQCCVLEGGVISSLDEYDHAIFTLELLSLVFFDVSFAPRSREPVEGAIGVPSYSRPRAVPSTLSSTSALVILQHEINSIASP